MKTQVDETCDWVKDSYKTLPYYLNERNIANTMQKYASQVVDPFNVSKIATTRDSISIQLNTGANFAICPILVQQWIDILVNGKKVDPFRLAGIQLAVSVTSVDHQNDRGGFVQEYIVNLLVDGQHITVTFSNTTLKIHLQGRSEILHSFSQEIFLLFLVRRVGEERRAEHANGPSGPNSDQKRPIGPILGIYDGSPR